MSLIIDDFASPWIDDPTTAAATDCVHQNICLLLRDLMYVAALVHAISDSDFGRVENLFVQLAMIFRGAGSNNYCMEILHLILNLKYIWTPDFVYVLITFSS